MTNLPNQVGIQKISESDLYISEPKPALFGNESNDSNNSNWTNRNWLKSRFHFSFAEWTTGRSNLGCLRVVNDDLIQPARGFGTGEVATITLPWWKVRLHILKWFSRC